MVCSGNSTTNAWNSLWRIADVSTPLPSVAVLLPVLNEAASIDACLASLAAQDYPGPWEILVADGGSTDDTLDLIGTWAEQLRIRVFDNPDRLQSRGLNLLAQVAGEQVLVRTDAHTTYDPDFISASVRSLLASGADAVGGPMRPEANTSFGRAVARAYRSKLGIGPAPFHHSEEPTSADTVYLGTMQRSTFLDLGGMRTFPSMVAEDADFYYRLRAAGGRVLLDPAIKSTYHPRERPSDLWRQFYRYGLGKADMLQINGEFPSWRPLAPLSLILGVLLGLAIGIIFSLWLPLLILVGLWLAVLIIGAKGDPLGIGAIAVMHVSYGLGLLRGLLRTPSSVRAAVG